MLLAQNLFFHGDFHASWISPRGPGSLGSLQWAWEPWWFHPGFTVKGAPKKLTQLEPIEVYMEVIGMLIFPFEKRGLLF